MDPRGGLAASKSSYLRRNFGRGEVLKQAGRGGVYSDADFDRTYADQAYGEEDKDGGKFPD